MDGYRTVVVGTDGSESSMRAVEARGRGRRRREMPKLIIASAHVEQKWVPERRLVTSAVARSRV